MRFSLNSAFAALLLVSSVGCPGPGREIRETDATSSTDPAPEVSPSCEATVDLEGAISVNGHNTGLIVEEDYLDPRARGWPFDENHVLVGSHPSWDQQGGGHPGEVLWKVACANGHPTQFLHEEWADFGNAAVTPDGRYLYYTARTGVARLDLTTTESVPITVAPDNTGLDCWVEEVPTRDVVDRWDGDQLVIRRGGPCGFEADWEAWELRVDVHPDDEPSVRRSYPVASVAVDMEGQIWLGNGGRCDSPGVRDLASDGAVLRSRDRGASWEEVALLDGSGYEVIEGVQTVVADSSRSGHLVVLTSPCIGSAAVYGGSVLTTRDGGVSWTTLPLPESSTLEIDMGQGIGAIEVLEENIDHLRIWLPTEYPLEHHEVWETEDSGESWRQVEWVKLPTLAEVEMTIGGDRLSTDAFGLVRTRDGQRRYVYPGDVFDRQVAEAFRVAVQEAPDRGDEYFVARLLVAPVSVTTHTLDAFDRQAFTTGLEAAEFLVLRGESLAPSIGQIESCEAGCCRFAMTEESGLWITSVCLDDVSRPEPRVDRIELLAQD